MEQESNSGVSVNELFSNSKGLSYDDIIILDTIYSEIDSREIDISASLGKGIVLKVPIISSPMDTVTESGMAIAMALCGGIGVIHNNCSTEYQVNEIKKVKNFEKKNLKVLFACGTREEEYSRLKKCFEAGGDGVIVDTSQGNTKYSLKMIKYVKENYPEKLLVGGNVSTKEACKNIIDSGADVIRIGQSCGSICITSKTIGIGRAQAAAVYECGKYCRERKIPIIADGGIKNSGDIFKALALGANFVMIGNLLARCEESSGKVISNVNGVIKKYRGMGCRDVLNENKNFRGYSSEAQGISGGVPLSGNVSNFIKEKVDSLKKSFHVVNSKNIQELHNKLYSKKIRFERLSNSGFRELGSHSVIF